MQNATNFLIQAILSIALYIVLLRFWMQWVRADFRNEIGQFIISVTNPIVIPLRKILPSIGTVDTATVVLALVVCVVKIFAYLALSSQPTGIVSFTQIATAYALMAIGLFIKSSIYLFCAAIIIGIIASWINPHSYHPVLGVARSIGEPLLAPARRLIPSFGGLDFSPMLVFLLLQASLFIVWQYLLPIPV